MGGEEREAAEEQNQGAEDRDAGRAQKGWQPASSHGGLKAEPRPRVGRVVERMSLHRQHE